MNVGGSSEIVTSCVEVSSTPLDPHEFDTRHFRDLTSESYAIECAEIVVYYWWATQTALSADWDTMGVAWVVHDSLWDALCATAYCRQ